MLTGYREACGTVGRRVRAELPDGSAQTGTATEIDDGGQLLVELADGTVASVAAGDVVHLRHAD